MSCTCSARCADHTARANEIVSVTICCAVMRAFFIGGSSRRGCCAERVEKMVTACDSREKRVSRVVEPSFVFRPELGGSGGLSGLEN